MLRSFVISANVWVGGREQSATDGQWLWDRSGTVVEDILWCPGEPSGDSGESQQDAVDIKLQANPVCLNDRSPAISQPALCEADVLWDLPTP